MADVQAGMDVDEAWDRFRLRVKDEPIPQAWQRASRDESLQQITTDGLPETSFKDMNTATGSKTMLSTMSTTSGSDTSPQQATSVVEWNSNQLAEQPVKKGFSTNIRSRRNWRLGVAVAMVAACVGLFASSYGQQAIAAAMRTFYVRHLYGISAVDMQSLLNELSFGNQKGTQTIDLKQYGNFEVSRQTAAPQSPQSLSLATVARESGYTLKQLPGVSPAQTSVQEYSPATEVSLRLHVAAINQLIWQIGGKTGFPSSANDAPIVLTIPPRVKIGFYSGPNQFETLTQMRVPQIQVPENVNLNQVRQALVGLPFLPGDIRQSLGAQNWTENLYLPEGQNEKLVHVGGLPVLVSENHGFLSAIWTNGGYVYHLVASNHTLVNQSALLKTVEEISR